jgi:hypothetical protein
MSFLIFFVFFISACDRNRTGWVQTTIGPFPGTGITFSSIHSTTATVSWGAATDKVTPAASLMYKLVRSASNNLGNVTDAESNGTLVMEWTANTLTYAMTGLSVSTTYYFAVLVKDASGRKAIYPQQSTTTAGTPEWAWVAGGNIVDQSGTYGTDGVAASTNIPGARMGSAYWTDGNGNLWVFGGGGYDSVGSIDDLNDLWKFDGMNWTWI